MNNSSTEAELGALMSRYEAANNSHMVARVLPFIAPEATYWFSDGSHAGHDEIAAALQLTFDAIADEDYQIRDLEWVVVRPDVAVCRYRFAWSGVVDGVAKTGVGRGTNVLEKRDGDWLIVHEQLTAD